MGVWGQWQRDRQQWGEGERGVRAVSASCCMGVGVAQLPANQVVTTLHERIWHRYNVPAYLTVAKTCIFQCTVT